MLLLFNKGEREHDTREEKDNTHRLVPLQRFPMDRGNSLFLDDHFNPYQDQWLFLQSINKMSEEDVSRIVEEAAYKGKIVGFRMSAEEDEEKPWDIKPSRKASDILIDLDTYKDSPVIELILANYSPLLCFQK
jgi:hypothetical protein